MKEHNGQSQLCRKLKLEVMDMLKGAKGDLRRKIKAIDTKLHRENKPTLTGQEALRMFYDSLQGDPHEKKLHDLKKFLDVKMENNDLRAFDAEWDNRLDNLVGIDLQLITENESMLMLRYLEQVRPHPLLKFHMA